MVCNVDVKPSGPGPRITYTSRTTDDSRIAYAGGIAFVITTGFARIITAVVCPFTQVLLPVTVTEYVPAFESSSSTDCYC